jgi:hypothetical protein
MMLMMMMIKGCLATAAAPVAVVGVRDEHDSPKQPHAQMLTTH